MSANEVETDTWGPVPPGEFSRMLENTRTARPPRVSHQVITLIAAFLLGLACAYEFIHGGKVEQPDHHFANVSCTVVEQQIDEYRAGSLDPSRQHQLYRHMVQCPQCSQLLLDESP